MVAVFYKKKFYSYCSYLRFYIVPNKKKISITNFTTFALQKLSLMNRDGKNGNNQKRCKTTITIY